MGFEAILESESNYWLKYPKISNISREKLFSTQLLVYQLILMITNKNNSFSSSFYFADRKVGGKIVFLCQTYCLASRIFHAKCAEINNYLIKYNCSYL